MAKELNSCLKFIKAWILLYCFVNTSIGLLALFVGDFVRGIIEYFSETLNLRPYLLGAFIMTMSLIGIYGVIADNVLAVSLFGLYILAYLLLFTFKVEHEQLKTEQIVSICAVLLGGSIPSFILSCNL